MRHIGIICVIDDPFDPPGHGRFGGGHTFMFDLGRYLIRNGHQVSYVTRLNSETKSLFDNLGPRCSILRIPAGPPKDVDTEQTSLYIDFMEQETTSFFMSRGWPDVIHAQYWVSGEIARRLKGAANFRFLFHPLSFGRQKYAAGTDNNATSDLRMIIEPAVLYASDVIVAVTPYEKEVLREFYPEVNNEKCVLVPHGVDTELFIPRPDTPDHYFRRQANRFLQGTGNHF
jgi:glycosyltransferase involved in cell wall biosynthesis